MKDFLNKANAVLKPIGYRKKGNSFWKIDNEIYKLINFQKSAFRGDWFFINLGIHPLGLPSLQVNQLLILEKPKEYECIISQRIEEAIKNEELSIFKEEMASVEDNELVNSMLYYLSKDVDQWLNYWGSNIRLANASKDKLVNMFAVVPRLKEKAFFMLKFYCLTKINKIQKAREYLNQYLSLKVDDLDFSKVDNYLKSLIDVQ